MNKLLVAAWLAIAPWPVLAQHLAMPELYDVRGVVSGEKLNVRAEPNARSSVLESLPHDAKGIEVLAIEGNWGQVNVGEGTGWVTLNYMEQQPSIWKNGQLPTSLSCFGTEPFWTLSVNQDQLRLAMPDQPTEPFAIESVVDRGFPADRLRAVQAGDLTALIVPKACSDGMSDRSYALEAVVLRRGGARPLLSGCCTIAPKAQTNP